MKSLFIAGVSWAAEGDMDILLILPSVGVFSSFQCLYFRLNLTFSYCCLEFILTPSFSVSLPPSPSMSTSEPATRVLSLSCQRSHECDDILSIAYLCSKSSLVLFCFSTAYLSRLQIAICSQTLNMRRKQ